LDTSGLALKFDRREFKFVVGTSLESHPIALKRVLSGWRQFVESFWFFLGSKEFGLNSSIIPLFGFKVV
jgi:hypothetical protein